MSMNNAQTPTGAPPSSVPGNLGNAPGAPGGENLQVSAMPAPPMQYAKNYTDENVRRGIAPPPPQPLSDSYTMFGNVFTAEDCIVASLESQGIRRLYSAKDVDRKKELRKLNHSVLVNFLDLLDFLIKTPDSDKRVEKIADLNLLFIHMHHLINEFRPHQARETLRVMLHVQKKKRHNLSEKFQEILEKVQETIQEALSNLPDQDEDEGLQEAKTVTDDELMSKNISEDEESRLQKAKDAAFCELIDCTDTTL